MPLKLSFFFQNIFEKTVRKMTPYSALKVRGDDAERTKPVIIMASRSKLKKKKRNAYAIKYWGLSRVRKKNLS